MRGTKVKRLRKAYRVLVERLMPFVPEGMGIISFRVYKRRVGR